MTKSDFVTERFALEEFDGLTISDVIDKLREISVSYHDAYLSIERGMYGERDEFYIEWTRPITEEEKQIKEINKKRFALEDECRRLCLERDAFVKRGINFPDQEKLDCIKAELNKLGYY